MRAALVEGVRRVTGLRRRILASGANRSPAHPQTLVRIISDQTEEIDKMQQMLADM